MPYLAHVPNNQIVSGHIGLTTSLIHSFHGKSSNSQQSSSWNKEHQQCCCISRYFIFILHAMEQPLSIAKFPILGVFGHTLITYKTLACLVSCLRWVSANFTSNQKLLSLASDLTVWCQTKHVILLLLNALMNVAYVFPQPLPLAH